MNSQYTPKSHSKMGSSNYNFSFEPPQSSSSNSYTYGTYSSFQRPFMPSLNGGGSHEPEQPPPSLTGDPAFDILEWHPAYQSCQRYFLDHAQHEPGTQALCALINVRLPFQYLSDPVTSSTPPNSGPAASSSNPTYNFSFPRAGSSSNQLSPNRSRTNSTQAPPAFVSLIPYIRRLVVTGFDKSPILHGFFGDDYARGVLPHLDCERRNYLFAAKHGGWRSCKKQYDSGSGMGGDESVPFMKPLDEAKMEELTAAEKAWSGWLAMEDWMVGPRAPPPEAEDSVEASSAPSGGEGAHMSGNENTSNGVGVIYRQS